MGVNPRKEHLLSEELTLLQCYARVVWVAGGGRFLLEGSSWRPGGDRFKEMMLENPTFLWRPPPYNASSEPHGVDLEIIENAAEGLE